MFNKLKRVIAICLISLISIVGVNAVNASTIDMNGCGSSYGINENNYKTYTVKNSVTPVLVGKIFAYSSGGQVVYCTEHGVPFLNEEDNPSFVSSSHTVENSLIAKVLAYGYNSSSAGTTCSISRAATQVLVHMAAKEIADGTTAWRGLSQSQIAGLLSGSDANSIASKAVDIRTNVLNYEKTPSFSLSTKAAATQDPNRMELKYSEANHNFSNSETDSKGVLSTFSKSTDPTSITSTISSNKLTITSKDDAVTTPIDLYKSFPSGGTVFYRNKGGTLQDTTYFSNGTPKTIHAYVGYKYQEIGKGTVKVHKIDKYTGKNLKNATFGIFKDNKCATRATDYLGNNLADKLTDKNGMVEWTNLYYPLDETASRIYYIKETKTPPESQYAVDSIQMEKLEAGENDCVPVTIKPANEDVGKKNDELQAIYNIPYGNITILKQDADTAEGIEGVEFKLLKYNKDRSQATDINGNAVANAVTNKVGVAEFANIPYGDYVLEEVKTTKSYKVLEEPIEFTLNKDTDSLKYQAQGTEALPLINEEEGFTYLLGDPTADKKIDAEDVAIMDKVIAKDSTVTTAQKYACDVNLDSKVNQTDKTLMNAYITNAAAGKTPEELKTIAFEGLKKITVEGELLLPLDTYKLGDPTEDGVIDNNDLTIVQNIVNGTIKTEGVTKVQKYASDINKDGTITEDDLNLIKAYVTKDETVDTSAIKWLDEIAYPDQFQKRVTLVVTNIPIDMKVSKQSITKEKEIKGAIIVIKNEKGEIFKKYTSKGKPEEFYIPAGEYTLTETVSPKGYENLKTVVKFRMGTDGQAKILSAKSDMYKLIKSKEKTDSDLDHLIIYNKANKISIPDTASSVAFLTIITGAILIGGGSYVIYKRYKTTN